MSDRSWSMVKWVALGAVALAILGVPMLPGRTEPVTRDRLDQARRLWQSAEIHSYSMDLETTGAQTGRYHVEVRDGRLQRITRNGQPADPAAGEYWTVEGLFLIIEEELDAKERPESQAFPQRDVWLRMRVDPSLGYPVQFIRQVPNTQLGVEIRVLRFDTSPGSPPS